MKKKPEPKPKVLDKPLTDLEDFQAQYGDEWRRLIAMPVFRAGLQLLNVRSLDQISSLSNEEIEKNSVAILSVLIGQLRHENDLFNLHQKKEFKFPLEEQEEYMSPEEEAAHQQLRSKFIEEQRKRRYGN